MKRTLALTLLAFTVPFVPDHSAVAQSAPALAVACPSDAPITPPIGDVDQFVAFDSHGCPVPTTTAIVAGPPAGVVTATDAPPAPVPPAASPAPVKEGGQPLADGVVTIPVEDGFVATTGEAEAEAASRPKPTDYQQRLDSQYCADLPWKCSDASYAELYG